MSHSLFNLAERDGRASYPQFTARKCGPRLFAHGGHDDSRGVLRGRHVPKRGHERAQFAMLLDAPEALGGAQQAEPDPPPAHVAIAPALDVPRDVPQRPDQILDSVRRGEETPQRRRQPQLQHRERVLQALAHTGGRIGVAVPLEPRREGRQLAARRRRTGRPIRPAQGGPDVELARLRHKGVEVAPLVELTAYRGRDIPTVYAAIGNSG